MAGLEGQRLPKVDKLGAIPFNINHDDTANEILVIKPSGASILGIIAENGKVRVKVGDHVAKTFTAATNDELTITGHNYTTGDGPYQVISTADLADGLNVAAVGTLTAGSNVGEDETVTIGSKVYTFNAILGGSDGDVDIGTDAEESLDNLINAIILGPGSGSAYAAAMTLNADVTAAPGAGDTMDVTAKNEGVPGNSVATTDTWTDGAWGAATLLGGSNTPYFIIVIDANKVKLALSNAAAQIGTAVDIISTGSGVHTIAGMPDDPPPAAIDGTGSLVIVDKGMLEITAPDKATFKNYAGGSELTTWYWM